MRDTITILGIPIDRITKKEAGIITENLIKQSNKTCKMVFAPNVEFIMYAQKDKEYYDLLRKSDLSTPDSIGVIIGAKLQHKQFKERIPGQEYFREIIELSNKKGYSIYLLGGEEGIAEKAKENLKKSLSPAVIFFPVSNAFCYSTFAWSYSPTFSSSLSGLHV